MGLARRRALNAAGAGLLIACAAAQARADDEDAAERRRVIEAAAQRGCVVRDERRDLTRLGAPHEGIIQVRCADSHIIWFEKVDGAWTLKPLG